MLSTYRPASEKNSKSSISHEASVSAIRMSEFANYEAADAIVTISLTDKLSILKYDSAKTLAKKNNLFVVPFIASPWETCPKAKVVPFVSRQGLIFVGNMVNPTNIEGLRWFLLNVMPELTKRDPNMYLTVIGGGGWTLHDIDPIFPIRYIGILTACCIVI